MAGCSLWLALGGASACSGRVNADLSTAAPSTAEAPAPTCAEPVAAKPEMPAPSSPLLHDSYGVELDHDADDLYVDKVYTFVGPVMRVRTRYVDPPEGDIQHSTYTSCEVEVEAPIVWNQRGFSVLHTVTARAERGDFVRDEKAPSKDGSRRANSDKNLTTCWVTLLAGDYSVDERSTASTEGRPKDFRLTEPGGEIFVLQAIPQPSASDLVEVVDRHFWR